METTKAARTRKPYNKFTAAIAVEKILDQLTDQERAYVLAFVAKGPVTPAQQSVAGTA